MHHVANNQHIRQLLIIGVGLLPLLAGVILFGAVMQADLRDSLPTWSDEIYYWHQAATFREAGLGGGYYSVNEQPAPAAFARYYAWGVAVPAVYGTAGRVLGWSLHAVPFINLGLLGAALISFLWVIRANTRQIVLAGGVVVTFAPFLLFSASSMIEVLHHAVAVLLAGLFYRLAAHQHAGAARPPGWFLRLFTGVLLAAALLRLTWGLLLIPLFVLTQPLTLRRGLLATLAGGVLIILMVLLTQSMAAPYSQFVQSLLASFRNTPSQTGSLLLDHISSNLQLMSSGHLMELLLRMQTGCLVLWLIVVLWRQRHDRRACMEGGLHVYNLSAIAAFSLVVYDLYDWRDYRLIAAHLLLTLLILVACQHYRLLLVYLASAMLILPLLPETYTSPDWYRYHTEPERRRTVADWSERLAAVIRYQPAEESGWCNTLLYTPVYLFEYEELLLAVPPGMGLSVILEDSPLRFPLKSRYLLLADDFVERHADALRLTPLLAAPDGALWLNEEADCP